MNICKSACYLCDTVKPVSYLSFTLTDCCNIQYECLYLTIKKVIVDYEVCDLMGFETQVLTFLSLHYLIYKAQFLYVPV